MCQLGTQGSLEQGPPELIEPPFLAEQVFRLLVPDNSSSRCSGLIAIVSPLLQGYPRIRPTRSP
jgi:hypothetical protein